MAPAVFTTRSRPPNVCTAAATIAKRLTGKGYPAFVLDPAGGPRIYRVQVGGYSDKNDAEQAARRLERDEQFKPFVRSR